MLKALKKNKFLLKLTKSRHYARLRQYFPQTRPVYLDDREWVREQNAETILIDWPENVPKPHVGLIRDYGVFPRWTKYIRFLENNHFSYEIYNIHTSDWIEKAQQFDLVIGTPSSYPHDLENIRRKTWFLENQMRIPCYPNTEHITLYEDKRLEAFYSKYFNFPFVKTYISHDRDEAMQIIESLKYPVVSKIDPSSASVGVELIRDLKSCQKLVKQVFSPLGRKTHSVYFRQKNYIYLQDFIPYDGYDLRVILIDNMAFGYYRKTPTGEFRASGMDIIEKRSLPAEAIRIAHQINQVIRSPQLVVDMLHGLDGQYHIIEISPFCQIETPEQLMVDDEPGVYIIKKDGSIVFEKGKYWVHELALKQFLLQTCLSGFVISSEYSVQNNV